jgi:hypothetical protein
VVSAWLVTGAKLVGMLQTTRELLDRYAGEGVASLEEQAYLDVIDERGTRADIEGLLEAFLQWPAGHGALLPVLARRGDAEVAHRLMERCLTTEGRLRDGMPEDLLHAVGYLGYQPVEEALWAAVTDGVTGWAEAASACFGLLNLPCVGLRDRIAAEIERHAGENFWPSEYLPALAIKTCRDDMLPLLVDWGRGNASTNCNAGLILGIALYGDAGRAAFSQLMWDPYWEAHSTATGSIRATYTGARYLNMTFVEMLTAMRGQLAQANLANADKRHAVRVVLGLLDVWAKPPWLGLRGVPDAPSETPVDLLRHFEWSNPLRDDSLAADVHSVFDDDSEIAELYRLRDVLTAQAREQLKSRLLVALGKEQTGGR